MSDRKTRRSLRTSQARVVRVERREQAVRHEYVGTREAVEQRRLAGVGVADEADRELVGARAHLAQAPLLDLHELAPQVEHTLAQEALVGLQLRLARATRADRLTLVALEVRPHALEPRQQVLRLRELDLQPRLTRARAAREDVEDQLPSDRAPAPVQAFSRLRDLGRGEVVVDDDEVGAEALRQGAHLGGLAGADPRGGVGLGAVLDDPVEDVDAGGVGEARELLERGVVGLRVAGQMQTQQDGLLAPGTGAASSGVELQRRSPTAARGGEASAAGAFQTAEPARWQRCARQRASSRWGKSRR